LENTPEISFIDNMTLQETENMVIEQYKRLYKEEWGKEPELADGDPKSLLIKAFAIVIYQVMQYIDGKGRAELLKTSTGDALDNLAALLGVTRQKSSKATATERFTLSGPRNEYVAVPLGTRVKTQGGRYFNTLDYAEIPIGETYVDVMIQAEEAGSESNDIQEGSIDTLVDPIPYIASVTNISKSTGGLDVEDDDSLTERVYLAPSKFSSAGPKDAYEYYVKEWRSDVADVQITSPSPCVIEIFAVLDDGRTLNDTERESLREYINGEVIRPLCDKVICTVPEEVEYKIEFTYWIATSDKRSAGTIQEQVESAVNQYQIWQRKLGRDINPTELVARIREAGAKRVKLTAPGDLKISDTQLPKCSTSTVTYGGLEDD
jgi:phage-related baseplate assembly protein